MFGFINIYKPKEMTSHDVVSFLRRIAKIKQIGHAGTLDPFAEGVLPVAIGKATKLIEYLDDAKAYKGVIQLGKSTETYDIEGKITNTSDKLVTKDDIGLILPFFRGEITQTPPIYSALKVKGKKLYEYARKGEAVEIKSRTVNIGKLELINFNSEQQQAELYIECSKGTYIRSLANDIGEKLGTYGHLIKLTRIKSGRFAIDKSVNLESLKTAADVSNNIINPILCLNYQIYNAKEDDCKLISNGVCVGVDLPDGITLAVKAEHVISVGKIKNRIFYPQKVFI